LGANQHNDTGPGANYGLRTWKFFSFLELFCRQSGDGPI
jgi:hypothetical protein